LRVAGGTGPLTINAALFPVVSDVLSPQVFILRGLVASLASAWPRRLSCV